MSHHSDHDRVPAMIDYAAFKEAIGNIEAGMINDQEQFIETGVEQLKFQLDRAVRLGKKE